MLKKVENTNVAMDVSIRPIEGEIIMTFRDWKKWPMERHHEIAFNAIFGAADRIGAQVKTIKGGTMQINFKGGAE